MGSREERHESACAPWPGIDPSLSKKRDPPPEAGLSFGRTRFWEGTEGFLSENQDAEGRVNRTTSSSPLSLLWASKGRERSLGGHAFATPHPPPPWHFSLQSQPYIRSLSQRTPSPTLAGNHGKSVLHPRITRSRYTGSLTTKPPNCSGHCTGCSHSLSHTQMPPLLG